MAPTVASGATGILQHLGYDITTTMEDGARIKAPGGNICLQAENMGLSGLAIFFCVACFCALRRPERWSIPAWLAVTGLGLAAVFAANLVRIALVVLLQIKLHARFSNDDDIALYLTRYGSHLGWPLYALVLALFFAAFYSERRSGIVS